ncbi:MAG: flagellar hook-basal body complex protein FliE [Alphaproteobacteria bacterium]|nr:flagellar hook-basal body complex protein FliE [Alphaproteobacteria bacterium]
MALSVNPAAINAYAQAAKMAITGGEGAAAAGAVPGGSFGDVLSGVVNDAISSSRAAETKAASLVQGKGDLVDVVTAVNAAEMSLETVVAIRDRVISAYQEIMRMPI